MNKQYIFNNVETFLQSDMFDYVLETSTNADAYQIEVAIDNNVDGYFYSLVFDYTRKNLTIGIYGYRFECIVFVERPVNRAYVENKIKAVIAALKA